MSLDDPNEQKSRSVRRALVFLLLTLQLLTVSIILSITHFSTNKDIDQQIEQLLESGLNESKEHTRGFLENADRAVKLSRELFESGSIIKNDSDVREDYFLSQLQTHPEMTGIYFASKQGDFYYISRDQRDDQQGFLTKNIHSDNPGFADFIWRGSDLVVRQRDLNKVDDFRPSERLWYQQAVAKKKLIWTDPYMFYTSEKMGITVAAPVFNEAGDIFGVIAVDIELTSLSEFLTGLKIFGAVSVFMVSEAGSFIAAPKMIIDEDSLVSSSWTTPKDRALALEKEAMDRFARIAKNNANHNIINRIDHQGKIYRLRYEMFDINGGPRWIIGAYALEDDFFGEMKSGVNRNVLIALAILLLSLMIGWFLIYRTWQPFERFFHDVITDQLTGLFNRRFLESIGSRMYIRLLRNQHNAISIAFINLDSFKNINSEFGNAIGNRALIEFSDFLKRVLRPEDIITRYSGDTFVIIFPGMENDCAMVVVDRMRKELDVWPLAIDDLLVRLTFSAGIETIDEKTRISDAAFTDFIQLAKNAMLNAKHKSRDRVVSANINNIQLELSEAEAEVEV